MYFFDYKVSLLGRVNISAKVYHAWNGNTWTLPPSLNNILELHNLNNFPLLLHWIFLIWKLEDFEVLNQKVTRRLFSLLVLVIEVIWFDFQPLPRLCLLFFERFCAINFLQTTMFRRGCSFMIHMLLI